MMWLRLKAAIGGPRGRILASLLLLSVMTGSALAGQAGASSCAVPKRARARDLGVHPGILGPGPLNAITDVAGVLVGQVTLVEGKSIRTGATAILPHGGNIFQNKVPAGVFVANGFGKSAGLGQIAELGEIETPIVLTNTLAVARGIDAILDWTLAQPGNESVVSVNAVVGETNDGELNDIRGRAITPRDILKAIEGAKSGPIEEGTVGAGTGTVAFGWKGGIGTSSRRLPASLGGYTVGVLVQSNYGGILSIDGTRIGEKLGQYYLKGQVDGSSANGSIMVVVATDAPLSDRNLTRLAKRAMAGVARTGSSFANGSGDYVVSFSTAESVRRTPSRRAVVSSYPEISNDHVSPLFEAVIEATEEAVYNSLFMATTVTSYNVVSGKEITVKQFPIAEIMKKPPGCP
jgi:D-aminopeptidase